MRSLTVKELFLVLLALVAAYLVIRMFLHSRPGLSPEDAKAAVEAGSAVLVDVREPNEWHEGVAAPAALLPLSDLRGARRSWASFLEQNRGKRIVLYCGAGVRSGMAASTLKSEGFDAINLGGYSEWTSRGLPVRRP
jgi:rhodanese-related sulfurtransferase